MRRRHSTWVGAGLALVLLPGCLPETPSITTEWSTPLQEVGLLPVDPPGEDLRVGDVFAYGEDPEPRTPDPSRFWLGRRSRWSSLPVRESLEAEYRDRPSWPPTPRAAREARGETSDGESVFTPEATVTRLRQVNLQSIVATIMGRDAVSPLVPSLAVNIAADTAWDDYKAITVSVRSAEGYSLALDGVLSLLVEERQAPDGASRFVLRESYRRHLPLLGRPDSGRVWLRVISEVVYLRAADLTVQSALPPDEVEDVPPPDVTAVRRPPRDDVPDEDPAVRSYRRAMEINRLLDDANVSHAPGNSTRILTVTDKSVSVRTTWSRPLALAARGVTLEVDKKTGVVLRLGPMGDPRRQYARPAAAEPVSPPSDL